MKTAAEADFELSTELLNQRLDGYFVLREVGHGAMGIVFEARQRGLERRVAVKVLPLNLSLRDRTVRRFLREAEAMGRLAHANIVDVYEVGSRGSLHYFAMRFVDGPPLDSVLKAGALAIDDVVQVGIDVSSALAHAHARGVLHRDVKPSNLLRDGERVVLTDFGLAKATDSAEAGSMTESGDLVGTPLYMSPEQILGEADGIDARSDVWGLGATLYELLVGRPPFMGTSAQSILHGILHRDPALLHRLRADVPRDLEAVVLKCLEKDRTRRYSGAAGLHSDLLALQAGQPVSARPPRYFDPVVRWSRRHPYQMGAIVLSLCALGFFLTVLRSSQRDLADSKLKVQAVDSERNKAVDGKTMAIARHEMLGAVTEWENSIDDHLRSRAFERAAALEARLSAVRRELEVLRAESSGIADPSGATTAAARWTRLDADLAAVRDELLLAADEWSSAEDEEMRLHAFDRVGQLMQAMPYEKYPEIAVEIMRVYASFMHEIGRDDAPLAEFGKTYGASEDWQSLSMHAAMLEGLERYSDALAIHHRRARLDPSAVEPWMEGAVVLRTLALRESTRGDKDAERRLLWQALELHDQALTRAVRARNEDAVASVLIERARCLLLLGQRAEARTSLGEAIAKDAARADALSLLVACDEEVEPFDDAPLPAAPLPPPQAVTEGPAAPPGVPGLTLPASDVSALGAFSGLPLVDRVPTTLDVDREDIEDAGRNLQAIYRGLRGVLRTAASGVRPDPTPSATPPSDGKQP